MFPMNVDDEKSLSKHNTEAIISHSHIHTNQNNHNNDNNDNKDDNTNNLNNNMLNVEWAKKIEETDGNTVKVRSLFYKTNGGIKRSTGPMIFRLVNVQSFNTEIMIDHIATHSASWYYQNIDQNDKTKFVIIIHFQVESIQTSFITYSIIENIELNNNNYHSLTNDKAFNKLFNLILNCDDKERNNRFKLIPRIVDGPAFIHKIIKNRPVLLGNHLPTKYFKGNNYFEIDCAVDQDIIARSIIKIAHKFANKLVVDMSWTIQGETIQELPERALCGITVHNMDFTKRNSLWTQYTDKTVDDYEDDDYF